MSRPFMAAGSWVFDAQRGHERLVLDLALCGGQDEVEHRLAIWARLLQRHHGLKGEGHRNIYNALQCVW